MPSTIPATSEGAVSDWVGLRNLNLGRSYLNNGAIIDPRRQGNAVKGWCQGSMPQPYRLHVSFGDSGIDEADCSCPVGGGGRCKHVGALLLGWLEQPGAFLELPDLEAGLEHRSKAELIALIKRMVQLEPRLETLLETALPQGSRGKAPVNPEVYRRQVSSAFRHGGDDWMAPQRIARDLGITLDAGDGFLVLADYAGASVVYQEVARGILEHYEIMPDEDGHLMDVMGRCVEGQGACLADAGNDAAVRESCLQALFGIYRFDVDFGGVGLGEDVPDLVLEHATDEEKGAVAGWVRAAMPRGDSWSERYHRRVYGRFLLDLEKAHQDDDSFLGICRESGLMAELVDRLLALGRLDDAVAEADSAGDYDLLTLAEVFRKHDCAHLVEPLLVRRIENDGDSRLAEWLKERYKERGEPAAALALAGRLLERRPDLARYKEVRELSTDLGVWQESRPRLLERWSAAGEYGLLTDIYLEEGEIDLALGTVRQMRPGFLGSVDRLIRVARAASKTHPQAALDIYRQQAERLIEARGRDNYQQACEHLTRVRDLYRQLSQEPEWNAFIAGLRERHRRLPALKEELNNAGL